MLFVRRAPVTVTRQCVRYISSSPKTNNSAPKIMSVLDEGMSKRRNLAGAGQGGSPLAAIERGRRQPDMRSEMQNFAKEEDYTKQMYRQWHSGDVYAPHDLSDVEQRKWKKGKKINKGDAFDVLGINPISAYKNFTIMSEYMTEMGRIKHSSLTGLRPVNQRKIAKAIRRAIGLGLMPSVHRHPLVLKKSSPYRFHQA